VHRLNYVNNFILRILFIIFFTSLSNLSIAQLSEFGGGIGGFNYAGDLMRGYHIENVKPGILGYYKMNLNNIFSVRASLTGGLISGSDKNPMDAFAGIRKGSFQSTIVEAALMMEFNFLDYKADYRKIRWSPYMLAGISGFTFFGGDQDLNGNSNVQLAIPFGGGFKYLVNQNISLNLEIGVRKLFFDHLDGYSDGDITNKNYQYGNKYDKDWYSFVGVSVSYILWKIPCPFDFY
jgi:hypothetical protein